MTGSFTCVCGNAKSYDAIKCSCCHSKNVSGSNNSNYKHGDATREKTDKHYWVWSSMIQRCTNVKNKGYQNYGGRGIFVCERWLEYRFFIEDMGKRPSEKHSIDRINNNDGYYKENCRWAERSEQMKNRREVFKNKTSKYKGVYKRSRGEKTYWAWSIRINGKTKSREGFKTEDEANVDFLRHKKENNIEQ